MIQHQHVFYEVEQKDGETRTEEIETTLNHLFWCEGEWKAAGALKAGDLLTLADGSQVEVTDITYEDRHTTVYNMEVADYHTYYVGEDGVWVHNTDKCLTTGSGEGSLEIDKKTKVTSPNQMNRQIERGQAPRGVVRVDSPDAQYAEPHVHFSDGTSITQSGKIHDASHGVPNLTNPILEWLQKNGWCLDID